MTRQKSILSLFLSCFISLSIILTPLVHACPLVKSFEGVIEYYQVEEHPAGFLFDLSQAAEIKDLSSLHTGLADHIDHQSCPPGKQYLFLPGDAERPLKTAPVIVSFPYAVEELHNTLSCIPPFLVHESLLASHKKAYTLFKSTLSPPSA